MKSRKFVFKILILLILSGLLYFSLQSKTESEPRAILPLKATPETVKIIPDETIPGESADGFVQLAWFYKPPEDGTPLYFLAENYDVFILTHYDEEERDELKKSGVDSPFLEYLLFAEIQNPGSCNKEPYGNQVAYKAGEFCTLLEEHPDWFLRDENGELIYKGRNVFMDPGNPEYREFWLTRAKEMREKFGWDGIFIDNVEASRNRFTHIGKMPVNYPDDESYQKEMEDFLAYAYTEYFEPQKIPVYANIVEYENEGAWLRYLDYLDGVMIEDFAVDYNDEYYDERFWMDQQEMLVEAQKRGKSLILVSQGTMNDTDRARFSFISYLLVNNGKAAFRYTGSDYYEEVWFYENYQLELGTPISDAYQVDGGWRRDFSKGFVFLDPDQYHSEIHLAE